MMKGLKTLIWVLFVMYILFMINLLFLNARGAGHHFSYNLVPFATIRNYIVNFNAFNFSIWFINLFGNILAFMPLTIFVPILFRKINSYSRVLILSFLTTLIVELTQLLLKRGAFDVDDMILNTLGGIAGYAVLKLVLSVLKVLDFKNKKKDGSIRNQDKIEMK